MTTGNKKGIAILIFAIAGMALWWSVVLNGDRTIDLIAPAEHRPQQEVLSYEVIRVDNSRGIGEVKVKLTNTASREILRAEVTCIALDASGREFDFETTYAIKSAEGLRPGQSTYDDFLFARPIPNAKSFRFKIKQLDWR